MKEKFNINLNVEDVNEMEDIFYQYKTKKKRVKNNKKTRMESYK